MKLLHQQLGSFSWLILGITTCLLTMTPILVRAEDALLLGEDGIITLDGCTTELVLEALEVICDCNPIEYYPEKLGLVKTSRRKKKRNQVSDEERERLLTNYINNMCNVAWNDILMSNWQDVNFDFTTTFMTSFMNGGTYLNLETGNLKTAEVDDYPTSDASRDAAEDINQYYKGGLIKSTLLEDISSFGECEYQTVMCCWGRDRQSNDNNGNCAATDCDNSEPADNTNS